VTAARRDGEAAIGPLQRHNVSSERQARQARAQALMNAAIHATPGDGLQIARAKIDIAPLAVFEREPQPRRRAPITDGETQKYVFVVAKSRAHRQRAAILATRQQGHAFPRLRQAVSGQMQRGEQCFDGLARNRVLRAVDVPPTGRHAAACASAKTSSGGASLSNRRPWVAACSRKTTTERAATATPFGASSAGAVVRRMVQSKPSRGGGMTATVSAPLCQIMATRSASRAPSVGV